MQNQPVERSTGEARENALVDNGQPEAPNRRSPDDELRRVLGNPAPLADRLEAIANVLNPTISPGRCNVSGLLKILTLLPIQRNDQILGSSIEKIHGYLTDINANFLGEEVSLDANEELSLVSLYHRRYALTRDQLYRLVHSMARLLQ